MPLNLRWRAGLSCLVGIAACSPTSPASTGSTGTSVVGPTVTLLVTNGSCQAGQCDSIRILGFPINQPDTPAGLWSIDLGVITTAQACITLPPSATFTVTGPGTTTAYVWNTTKGLALGALPPASSRFTASSSTATFVPSGAKGWNVTLPGVEVSAAAACTP